MLHQLATVVLAAEEGKEEASGVDLLLPTDLNEVWAGLIAFAVVFFVIWKFAVPAFNEMIENRQNAIKGELESAEQAKAEAATLLEDYKSQLKGARDDANQIVDDARASAEGMKSDIVAKANAEAEEIISKARTEAQGEKERALQEARDEVAALSLDLAEKVVGGSLDRQAQQGLVESYLAELDRMG
ncbi:MAG TPA: F0F1 ATP synthase subunit B [Acidimicrobiia bacterium]|jgi:F-type H+-transporting ATPase subunit b|nr:F0F1 ATP synthase subunit B [Acidimicrobiia bacterium]